MEYNTIQLIRNLIQYKQTIYNKKVNYEDSVAKLANPKQSPECSSQMSVLQINSHVHHTCADASFKISVTKVTLYLTSKALFSLNINAINSRFLPLI